jgi:hypothetical protein
VDATATAEAVGYQPSAISLQNADSGILTSFSDAIPVADLALAGVAAMISPSRAAPPTTQAISRPLSESSWLKKADGRKLRADG